MEKDGFVMGEAAPVIWGGIDAPAVRYITM